MVVKTPKPKTIKKSTLTKAETKPKHAISLKKEDINDTNNIEVKKIEEHKNEEKIIQKTIERSEEFSKQRNEAIQQTSDALITNTETLSNTTIPYISRLLKKLKFW